MKTTLNIDDELIKMAESLTGIKEKTALVHLGLQELIRKESQLRLADLGGTLKKLKKVPRRKIG